MYQQLGIVSYMKISLNQDVSLVFHAFAGGFDSLLFLLVNTFVFRPLIPKVYGVFFEPKHPKKVPLLIETTDFFY